MNIISIHTGHNATASLIKNNKLECALTEERFTNVKRTCGFPINSFEYILNEYELTPDNIDYVAFCSLPEKTHNFQWTYPEMPEDIKNVKFTTRIFNRFAQKHIFQGLCKKILEHRFTNDCIKSQKQTIEDMNKKYLFRKSQIFFLHHHVSHAYAPIGFFNLSKLNKPVLVFTFDGYGDLVAGTIGIYDNGEYKVVDKTHFFDSVAWIYGAVTHYFGMKMTEHEYKVMGLAAYPNIKYAEKVYKNKMQDLISVKNGKISLKYKTVNVQTYTDDVLKERFFMERFDNIAYAVQKLVEEKMVSWIKQNIIKYRINTIACGGGIFMNVKMNKKIQELEEVDKVYFMPSAGDESLPIGAGFYAIEKNNETCFSDEVTYLGKQYSNKEIEQYMSENNIEKKYEIRKLKNPEKETAQLISQGMIIGRFCGRNEWGARSLGNRAILGDPSRLETVETVNHAIKGRDFWMPFACSIIDRDFAKYAEFNRKSMPYYMITSYDSKEKAKTELKAGLHRKDYTMRPNVVTEKHNKKYRNIMQEFRKITGIGGVLNTSLNLHGYPMVGFLKDLFFTMDNSELNYCLLEDYMIKKKHR